jgi:hypothetical protein
MIKPVIGEQFKFFLGTSIALKRQVTIISTAAGFFIYGSNFNQIFCFFKIAVAALSLFRVKKY